MKRLTTIGVLLLCNIASANDYTCLTECVADGKSYNTCTSLCRGDPPVDTTWVPPKKVDVVCMSNCTTSGQQYHFCRARCTY